jgi:hypothetical protein
MQSLGTDGETQKHALLKPTLTAVPSLLYPDCDLDRSVTFCLQPNQKPTRENKHSRVRFFGGTTVSTAVVSVRSFFPANDGRLFGLLHDPLVDLLGAKEL